MEQLLEEKNYGRNPFDIKIGCSGIPWHIGAGFFMLMFEQGSI
jgi:hypothetical protein